MAMMSTHEGTAQITMENLKKTNMQRKNYRMDEGDTAGNIQHGIVNGRIINFKNGISGNRHFDSEIENKKTKKNEVDFCRQRRWVFALRHGERVDLTYGQWVPFCFDEDNNYVRKDLNMPLKLADRVGGKMSYAKDTPLTRVGHMQAQLVGEGLRLAGVSITHVYASAALRCVESAHALLQGLATNPSVKIRVEPGLFECTSWHLAKGLAPFMTPEELHKAGYNVDLWYRPYVDLDLKSPETFEEFYRRSANVMQSVVQDTETEGGNVIFVGHVSTLDMMVAALNQLQFSGHTALPPYELNFSLMSRIPYCGLAAMRSNPWQVTSPPCPPSINSSSVGFDWKMLSDVWKNA